jgi:hypothetical protein
MWTTIEEEIRTKFLCVRIKRRDWSEDPTSWSVSIAPMVDGAPKWGLWMPEMYVESQEIARAVAQGWLREASDPL